MKRKNVCDFSVILFCAEDLGYGWNTAHDILVDANIAAIYGAQDVYIEDIDEIENEDAKKDN